MKQTYIIQPDPHPSRRNAIAAVQQAREGQVVTVQDPTRSLEQNALLWPLLHAVAKQVIWYGQTLTPEEWKYVFTASLHRQRVVPGLDGGFVVCGLSTRVMGKKEFSDLLELIYAFGSEPNHLVDFNAA